MLAVLDIIPYQTTEHHNIAILGEHLGLYFALVGHNVSGRQDLLIKTGNLLDDIKYHGVALIDLWRYLQSDADTLTFDGLEGVLNVVGAAGIGV